MSGPLEREFAQVREALDAYEYLDAVPEHNEHGQSVARLALSAIERHVQDMEKALRFLEDFVIEHGLHDELVWKGSRAALPVREKGTETP